MATAPIPHVYSLCFFEGSSIVPDVELVEACDDEEAVDIARSRRLFAMREIWERHRLVAVIPATH